LYIHFVDFLPVRDSSFQSLSSVFHQAKVLNLILLFRNRVFSVGSKKSLLCENWCSTQSTEKKKSLSTSRHLDFFPVIFHFYHFGFPT
jgi:hypothetical protein